MQQYGSEFTGKQGSFAFKKGPVSIPRVELCAGVYFVHSAHPIIKLWY